MGILLEAIDIVLENYFGFGFHMGFLLETASGHGRAGQKTHHGELASGASCQPQSELDWSWTEWQR
jgi:hypothetical protein